MASDDESNSLRKQIKLNHTDFELKPIDSKQINLASSPPIDSKTKSRKSQKCDNISDPSLSARSSQTFNNSKNRARSSLTVNNIHSYPQQHFSSKQLYDHITNLLTHHFGQIDDSINDENIQESLLSVSALLCDSVLMGIMDDQKSNHLDSDELTTALVVSPELLKVQKHHPKKWCTHSKRSMWNEYIPSSALRDHPSFSIPANKYFGLLRGSVRQDWNTIGTYTYAII